MPSTATDRIDGLTTSVAVKAPCRAVSSANHTLNGEQSVGGVSCTEGDRVLLISQTDQTENGIWVVDTGDWVRARDFDGTRDAVEGTIVIIPTPSAALYMLTTTDSPVVFGTSLITFSQLTFSAGGAGSTSIVSVTDYGAAGSNADNSTQIQNAVNAMSTSGGGVYVPTGAYSHASAITLKSNVMLWGAHGASFVWTGGTTPQITTATTGYIKEAGISGLNLTCGVASKAIELYSPWRCTFSDITIASTSSTNILIDFLCNSSGTTNPDSNYNAVFCYVENILQTGTCGTFIRLRGNTASGTSQVVTLNTFGSLNAISCAVRGIDFSQWCDSNYFDGVTRVNMTANNGVGVEWNSASPLANVGVYANNFDHLAVDTFAGPSGRVGFKMNWTKLNKIGFYYNDPIAEGGLYIISSACLSYDFVYVDGGSGGTNSMFHYTSASRKAVGTFDMDIGTDTGSIKDLRLFAGGYMQVRVNHDKAAVNWIDLYGNTAGNGPIIRMEGSDTNINVQIYSKGTGNVILGTNHGTQTGAIIAHVPSAVNYWVLFESIAGGAQILRADGADANIEATIQSKGTDPVSLATNAGTNQVVVTHTASADRTINLTGSNGANPKISTSGGSLDVGSAVVFTNQTVGSTIGAAGAASALPANPLGYITTSINGTACKIPYYNT